MKTAAVAAALILGMFVYSECSGQYRNGNGACPHCGQPFQGSYPQQFPAYNGWHPIQSQPMGNSCNGSMPQQWYNRPDIIRYQQPGNGWGQQRGGY
jgi:hypothetical protein